MTTLSRSRHSSPISTGLGEQPLLAVLRCSSSQFVRFIASILMTCHLLQAVSSLPIASAAVAERRQRWRLGGDLQAGSRACRTGGDYRCAIRHNPGRAYHSTGHPRRETRLPLSRSFVQEVAVMQEPDPRQRTKLLKIGMRQCRYIVSDDPRRAVCCGAPTLEGSSWRDWHRRLVYVPTQPIKVRPGALAS
jgi:hypothetical protein